MGTKDPEKVIIDPAKPSDTLIDEYSYLLQGGALDAYKIAKKNGNIG